MSSIASLSAAELGPLYASKQLSPVEVAKDTLARIERFEPAVNAFAVRDEALTLAMAEASQARWLNGEAIGPLDGVPVTIKDNLGVAGWSMPVSYTHLDVYKRQAQGGRFRRHRARRRTEAHRL